MTDAIEFRPSAKIKMAAIELFKMYSIDTLFERYIFKTVSPVNFKFEKNRISPKGRTLLILGHLLKTR